MGLSLNDEEGVVDARDYQLCLKRFAEILVSASLCNVSWMVSSC